MGNSGSSGSGSKDGSGRALQEARKQHKDIKNQITEKNRSLIKLKDKNEIDRVTKEIESLQGRLTELNQKHAEYAMGALQKSKGKKKRVVKGMILGETLGKGTFGYVKMGYHAETNRQCAMKFLLKNTRGYRQEEVMTEIACMKLVDHKNVVKLFGSWMSVDYPTRDGLVEDAVLMMLEYCPGGDLYEIVYYTGKLEEKLVRTYSEQLMAGLYAIHSVGITHRDIKPNNVLLDHKFQLKITDFGLSHIYRGENADSHRMPASQAWMGTKGFQAPEQLLNRPYSNLVDIFASGVCIFMLLGAKQPFKKADAKDPWFKCIASRAYKKFWKAHGKEKFSESVKDLLQGMLAYQPKDRFTIHQVMYHPWVTDEKYSPEELFQVMRKLHLNAYQSKMKDERRQERMMKSFEEKNKHSRAFGDVEKTWEKVNKNVQVPNLAIIPFFGTFAIKKDKHPIEVMNHVRLSAMVLKGEVNWIPEAYTMELNITMASSKGDHSISFGVKVREHDGRNFLIVENETWKTELTVDRQIEFFWHKIWTDVSECLDGPYTPEYDDSAFDWSGIDVEALFEDSALEEVIEPAEPIVNGKTEAKAPATEVGVVR